MTSDEDFQREARLEQRALERLKYFALRKSTPDPRHFEHTYFFGGKHPFGAVEIQTGGAGKIIPLKQYTRTIDPTTGFPIDSYGDPRFLKQLVGLYDDEIGKAEVKQTFVQDSKGLSNRLRVMRDKREWHQGQLDDALSQAERQNQIRLLRDVDVEVDALAGKVGEAARQYIDFQRQIWDLNGSPNYRPENSSLRPIVTDLQRQQEMHANSQNLGPNLLKWNRLMTGMGLNSADWLSRGSKYVLAAPVGDVMDIHRYMTGGFDATTGKTYYPSELTDIEGITYAQETIDEMTRLHPMNASKHPEVTDSERYRYHPAWFDEDPAITSKKRDDKFRKETGAPRAVPMETPINKK